MVIGTGLLQKVDIVEKAARKSVETFTKLRSVEETALNQNRHRGGVPIFISTALRFSPTSELRLPSRIHTLIDILLELFPDLLRLQPT